MVPSRRTSIFAPALRGAEPLVSTTVASAAGMFLIGTLASALWIWSRRHEGSAVAQLIYANGPPFVVILMRGTIPDTLGRMLFLFVPLVMLLWLMRLRFGSKPRRNVHLGQIK